MGGRRGVRAAKRRGTPSAQISRNTTGSRALDQYSAAGHSRWPAALYAIRSSDPAALYAIRFTFSHFPGRVRRATYCRSSVATRECECRQVRRYGAKSGQSGSRPAACLYSAAAGRECSSADAPCKCRNSQFRCDRAGKVGEEGVASPTIDSRLCNRAECSEAHAEPKTWGARPGLRPCPTW